MAGLPMDHTAVGRLALALREPDGASATALGYAYGQSVGKTLQALVSEGVVQCEPSKRGARYKSTAKHTALREAIVLDLVSRAGSGGISVAQITEQMPESAHRVEMALANLIRTGRVERFRLDGTDRRTPKYRTVQ